MNNESSHWAFDVLEVVMVGNYTLLQYMIIFIFVYVAAAAPILFY